MFWSRVDRLHSVNIPLRPCSLLFILSSFQKTMCVLSFGYNTCSDSCWMEFGRKPENLHSTWMAGTMFWHNVVNILMYILFLLNKGTDLCRKPQNLHSNDCTWKEGTIFWYHVVQFSYQSFKMLRIPLCSSILSTIAQQTKSQKKTGTGTTIFLLRHGKPIRRHLTNWGQCRGIRDAD